MQPHTCADGSGVFMGEQDQSNDQSQPKDQIDEASRRVLKRVDHTGAYFRSLFARSVKLNLGGLFDPGSDPRPSDDERKHDAVEGPHDLGTLKGSAVTNGSSSEKQATKDVDSG
jgi:hypothetical protein